MLLIQDDEKNQYSVYFSLPSCASLVPLSCCIGAAWAQATAEPVTIQVDFLREFYEAHLGLVCYESRIHNLVGWKKLLTEISKLPAPA